MKRATELTLAAVFFAAVAAAVLIVRHLHQANTLSATDAAPRAFVPATPPVDSPMAAQVASAVSTAPVSAVTPGATSTVDGFEIDSAGNLVLTARTLEVIRSALAGKTAEELPGVRETLARDLPPAAARRAQDLLDRYQSYQQVMLVQFPPDHAPPTDEDATQLLDSLHALRVEQFGADVTQALFGDEEATQRSMAALIRNEKDQSLTPQQRAAYAEALREPAQSSAP
jgi:lipase chaperone LimK